MQRRKTSAATVKAAQSQDSEATPFEKFDRLFRAVVAVPKEAVEREEAKERLKNRAIRAKRKRAKKRA
jgi:hypothetical protein